MSKRLLEITSKIHSLVKKNQELISQLTVAQSTSKLFQEAFNTSSSKLKLELHSREEWLDLPDIFNLVVPKDKENFALPLSHEFGVDLDKSRIVHRTIVNFLNRKDAENVVSNKRKLKVVDTSCLFSDGIQDINDMTTRGQIDWREEGLFRKKKNFYITKSLPVLQVFVWLSQREEGRGSDFLFLSLQRNHPHEKVTGFTCN